MTAPNRRLWHSQLAKKIMMSENAPTVEEAILKLVGRSLSMIQLKPRTVLKRRGEPVKE